VMRGLDQPGRNPVRQQEQGQQEPAPYRPSPTPGNAHRTGHRGAADSATAIGNENRSAALHQGACSGDAPSTVSAQSKAGMTGQQLSAKASDEKCGEFPIRRTRRLISRRHPNQRRPLVFRPAFVIGRNGTGIELHLLKALRLPVLSHLLPPHSHVRLRRAPRTHIDGSTAHGYASARPARKTALPPWLPATRARNTPRATPSTSFNGLGLSAGGAPRSCAWNAFTDVSDGLAVRYFFEPTAVTIGNRVFSTSASTHLAVISQPASR